MEKRELNTAILYAKARYKIGLLERQIEAQQRNYLKEIARLKHEIMSPSIVFIGTQDIVVRILQAVSQTTGITPAELTGLDRHRHIVIARQLFFFICRYRFDINWRVMSTMLNRDHSTAIHGAKVYKDYLDLGYKIETNYIARALGILRRETVREGVEL